MVSLIKISRVNGIAINEYMGLSTDNKPINKEIPNGSIFTIIDGGDIYKFDLENLQWIKQPKYTSDGTTVQGDYLPLSGGTMTGNINMANNTLLNIKNPESDNHAVNKKYVDDGLKKYLPLLGGTMQGNINMSEKDISNARKISLSQEPTEDLEVVNKGYVDEHNPVLDSGQEEFVLGQNDLAYVFKNSMVMDSGDRFYFADPVSLTDGRLVPFITSAMTGEEYHLLVGTYPKGIQDGTLAPVQIDGVAEPTGNNMAVNKKYVDDTVNSIIKYTDQTFELNITATTKEQWFSYDLAMQSGYTPVSATLVIDDENPFVGYCSLDITPDETYNALIYLKATGSSTSTSCKVRILWIKNS